MEMEGKVCFYKRPTHFYTFASRVQCFSSQPPLNDVNAEGGGCEESRERGKVQEERQNECGRDGTRVIRV